MWCPGGGGSDAVVAIPRNLLQAQDVGTVCMTTRRGDTCWLGGWTDSAASREYHWHTGEPVSDGYTHWQDGWPKFPGSSRRLVAVSTANINGARDHGLWNDEEEVTSQDAVCQLPAQCPSDSIGFVDNKCKVCMNRE